MQQIFFVGNSIVWVESLGLQGEVTAASSAGLVGCGSAAAASEDGLGPRSISAMAASMGSLDAVKGRRGILRDRLFHIESSGDILRAPRLASP